MVEELGSRLTDDQRDEVLQLVDQHMPTSATTGHFMVTEGHMSPSTPRPELRMDDITVDGFEEDEDEDDELIHEHHGVKSNLDLDEVAD